MDVATDVAYAGGMAAKENSVVKLLIYPKTKQFRKSKITRTLLDILYYRIILRTLQRVWKMELKKTLLEPTTLKYQLESFLNIPFQAFYMYSLK